MFVWCHHFGHLKQTFSGEGSSAHAGDHDTVFLDTWANHHWQKRATGVKGPRVCRKHQAWAVGGALPTLRNYSAREQSLNKATHWRKALALHAVSAQRSWCSLGSSWPLSFSFPCSPCPKVQKQMRKADRREKTPSQLLPKLRVFCCPQTRAEIPVTPNGR